MAIKLAISGTSNSNTLSDAMSVTRLGAVADAVHRGTLVRALDTYQFGLIAE